MNKLETLKTQLHSFNAPCFNNPEDACSYADTLVDKFKDIELAIFHIEQIILFLYKNGAYDLYFLPETILYLRKKINTKNNYDTSNLTVGTKIEELNGNIGVIVKMENDLVYIESYGQQIPYPVEMILRYLNSNIWDLVK